MVEQEWSRIFPVCKERNPNPVAPLHILHPLAFVLQGPRVKAFGSVHDWNNSRSFYTRAVFQIRHNSIHSLLYPSFFATFSLRRTCKIFVSTHLCVWLLSWGKAQICCKDIICWATEAEVVNPTELMQEQERQQRMTSRGQKLSRNTAELLWIWKENVSGMTFHWH